MQLLVMSFAVEGFWGAAVQNISAKFINNDREFSGPELFLSSGYNDIITS